MNIPLDLFAKREAARVRLRICSLTASTNPKWNGQGCKIGWNFRVTVHFQQVKSQIAQNKMVICISYSRMGYTDKNYLGAKKLRFMNSTLNFGYPAIDVSRQTCHFEFSTRTRNLPFRLRRRHFAGYPKLQICCVLQIAGPAVTSYLYQGQSTGVVWAYSVRDPIYKEVIGVQVVYLKWDYYQS